MTADGEAGTAGTGGGEAGGQLQQRRAAARRNSGEAWQEQRLDVLRVAARLFQRKGFQATTLKEIADELSMDRATLYRFFASKDELLRASVADSILEIAEETRAVVHGDGSSRAKLGEIIELVMRYYDRHYPHPYVFLHDMLDAAWVENSVWATQLVSLVREIQGLVFGVVEQGMRDGEFRDDVPVDVATNAVLGAVNWSYRWYRPGRPHSGQEVGHAFATILLQGLVSGPRRTDGP
jgi:AcrR family transcriptional regulator